MNTTTEDALTYEQRLARLDTLHAEGRLIRGVWQKTDDEGRELVCLLAALSPEAGAAEAASACPADVMPSWLAHMTPEMDDCVSAEKWPYIIGRYVALAHRWYALDAAAWRRAEYRVRAACVREAMQHTRDAEVLAVCKRVAALCVRVVAGDEPTRQEWVAEWAAARSAAIAAENAAAGAAMAASRAAASAAARASAERAAEWAAERAAEWAAESAAAGAASRAAARSAARAWDRIATAVLDGVETELVAQGEEGKS